MSKKINIKALLPILFGFFIMGFCDVVGISSSYVKQDFQLSDTQANILPSMLFVWFFVFSVPAGLIMNKIGRKRMVTVSMLITIISVLIPVFYYSYYSMLLAFALLGIGNTLIQVSLNPLLSNLLDSNKMTSAMTAGQFIKAISSFCGPLIAAVCVSYFGDWKQIFMVYGVITIISMVWLLFVNIPREQNISQGASLMTVLKLLKNRRVVALFIAILAVVGIDVGLNVMIPRLLVDRCGVDLQEASYGISLYFTARTIGTFLGVFLLARYSSAKFLRLTTLLAIAAIALMIYNDSMSALLILIAFIGLCIANVFSIIFSTALNDFPKSANELSGLMMMGVSGGALIPPIMGYANGLFSGHIGSLVLILICAAYLFFVSISIGRGRVVK